MMRSARILVLLFLPALTPSTRPALCQEAEAAVVQVEAKALDVAQGQVFIVNGQVIQADGDAIQKTRIEQLQKFLKGQVAFIGLLTTFSKEQGESFSKLDRKWLEESIKNVKPAKNNRNVGGGIFGFGGGDVAINLDVETEQDPVIKQMKANIVKEIDSILTEEQKRIVADEKAAKDQFKAEALADLSVSMLERHMYLKPEQVQQLKPALVGKINKQVGWTVYLNNR